MPSFARFLNGKPPFQGLLEGRSSCVKKTTHFLMMQGAIASNRHITLSASATLLGLVLLTARCQYHLH